jgi:hypothetical protein
MPVIIGIVIVLFILYKIGKALNKAGITPDFPDEIQEKKGHVEIIRHESQKENISRKPIVAAILHLRNFSDNKVWEWDYYRHIWMPSRWSGHVSPTNGGKGTTSSTSMLTP